MNKEFLPYYNSLNEKEKTFWLDCSKEELIDHFIANVKNGEVLLNRIDKANEILNKGCFEYDNCPDVVINEIIELKEILGGEYKMACKGRKGKGRKK